MTIDPVTLNVLWNRLVSTVNEQAAALMRTAFSSIVREAGDLAAGVFDRRGRMVAQATTGTPGHINPMATCMHHFLARFPLDDLEPGDVLITNDPWMTASQLNDITIATPIFKNGRPVALFANCVHALDIGGKGLSADALSVYEEGLAIPIMKLHLAGVPNDALLEMIQANVRTPVEVMGDIHSQIIANDVGGRRLLAFLDEFGLEDIENLADEITDRSEQAMRERILKLPDGTHHFEIKSDGFDAPITIRAAITIEGDQLTLDFDGTSPVVERGINVALNYTRGYATYGVICALGADVPNNDGSFRPIRVEAPEGSILNARHPAPVAGRHLVGHFLPSAVMGALAQALPEQVIAPGADALWDTHISGEGPDGKYFSYTWFSCGGTGGLGRKDGLSATAFPSGIAGVPVEVIEALSPLHVHERALRPDSGGAGQFRGGLGQTMSFSVRTQKPFQFAGLYERIEFPPPGIQGGEAGAAGRFETTASRAVRAKETVMLPADTRITIDLPGGGGFGDPQRRDPAAIRRDLRLGYVTPSAARDRYDFEPDP